MNNNMNDPKLYLAVKIRSCRYYASLYEETRIIKLCGSNPKEDVAYCEPGLICFEDGMVDFRFVVVAERVDEKSDKTERATVIEDDKRYFFGSSRSLEDLKENNPDGENDTLISSIERRGGIGLVISPNGFHSAMYPGDVVIDELSRKESFRRKL